MDERICPTCGKRFVPPADDVEWAEMRGFTDLDCRECFYKAVDVAVRGELWCDE